MNSYERVMGALNGQKIDRVPVIPIIREWCMFQLGYNITDMMTSIPKYAFSQFYCQQAFGYDAVFDLHGINAEAEAMGSKIRFSDDMSPVVYEHVIKDYETDMPGLKPLDPYNDGRLPHILEIISQLKELCQGKVPVIAYVQAPLRQAAMLRGTSQVMTDMLKKQNDLEKLLEKATESQIAWGKAVIKAGADMIITSDPISSGDAISKKNWIKWGCHYTKILLSELKKDNDVKTFMHICGDTSDRLETFLDMGLDGVSLDEKVDLAYARQILGDKMAVMGNVSPLTIFMGMPEEVEAEAEQCIEKAGQNGRFILMPGCVIPGSAKAENIKAMVTAAEKYGRY